MTWIYLSPHFDDVALSCGGLVWQQARAGEAVGIWTVCGGNPPSVELSPFARQLHSRWEAGLNSHIARPVEDIHSCQLLGASFRHFPFPDCIYRRNPASGEFMYASESALTGPIDPADIGLAESLREVLRQVLPAGVTLVCPLALGNHVDHQLTRLAAQGLARDCWYYADYPYVLRDPSTGQHLEMEGWEQKLFPISAAGLVAWQESILAHASQISTFWPGGLEMRLAVSEYLESWDGIRLWRPPPAE